MEHRSASFQRVRLPALLAAVCALPSLKHARLTALLATTCALPILLYLPFLQEPFELDEGFYATVVQVILDGGLPYRDAFGHQPPLIFGWYALSFLIFGQHVWAPRLVAAGLMSATTLVVYAQGRLLFSGREALLAALAFALSIGVARFHTNANAEYFMLLPLTAGLVTFTLGQQTGRLPWFFLSGVLSGMAIMTKEVCVFNFVFLVVWTLYPAWRRRGLDRQQLSSVALLVGGCSLVAVLTIAPFVGLGVFADYLDSVLFAGQYVGNRSTLERVLGILDTFRFPFIVAGPWMALSLFGCVYLIRNGDNRWGWLIVGWLVASMLSLIFVGRLYAHYFVNLLPALGLMAPLGVRFLRDRWQAAPARAAAFVFIVGVLAVGAIAINGQVYLHGSADERHLSKFAGDPGRWEVQSPALASYIADKTSPDESIFVLGFEAQLYFYADRRSATRYLDDHPFAADYSRIETALEDLKEETPTFVIDSARYQMRGYSYDRSGFDKFLADRYEYLGKMYYADVYRLKEESGSDSSRRQ